MAEESPAQIAPIRTRLLSLDALRGFDMLCIMGLEDLIRAMAHRWETPALETLAEQFEHVPWDGLHAYDLIFPLFMFLSGVALPLSMDARVDRGDSKLNLWGKVLFRCCVLVLLGMVYNGVFSSAPAAPRFASVLAQIGLAWGVTASIHLVIRNVGVRWAILMGWLVAIAVLHLVVPVPGHGAGVLLPEGAINAWFDRMFLPGRLHGGNFDPEGLLSIVFAVPLTMAGAIAGGYLKRFSDRPWKFVAGLAGGGVVAILGGVVCWNLGYPPVKSLWTASFDLFAIGIASILFALFYAVIDVMRFQSWSFPLRVIGMNSITIYLGSRLVSFPEMSEFIFGRVAGSIGANGPLLILVGILVLEWLVLYFFYRKKWFLRV